ncbi:MAG: hypothetical protein HYT73_03765 [Candidatus Aenigmarchaeota archaeon]|nr:hypothetical protein [Candidatus Aenigmarchaeota archaeon]
MPDEMFVHITPSHGFRYTEFGIGFKLGNMGGYTFARTSEDVASRIIDYAREERPSRISITAQWPYPTDELPVVKELVHEATGVEVR